MVKPMVTNFYSENVKRGAKLLSEIIDDNWFNNIDLEKLDLSDCFRCTLGQAFGEYGFGIMTCKLTSRECYEYGFNLRPYNGYANLALEYAELTRAWKTHIRELRNDQSGARV